MDSAAASSRAAEWPAVAGERVAGAQPLVKWAGGKTAILDELVARMPVHFGRLVEPFAGGAALAFHLGRRETTIGDRNGDLIHTYRVVRRHPDRVIRKLRAMAAEHGPAFYKAVRAAWNRRRRILAEPALETPSAVAADSPAEVTASVGRAATFLYLNRTCFNGLWRVNRRGEFNVPMGRYPAGHVICDAARIRAAAEVLASAQIWAGGWQDTIRGVRPRDFVYFDPPYVPASATASFTSYTAERFGPDDQVELAAAARALADRGVFVMVSNADRPAVRRLYRGFRIARVMVARSINSNGGARGLVPELIITGPR